MSKRPVGGAQSEGGERISSDTMKKLQDQIRSTLEPFVQDIRKLSETNLSSLIQNLQSLQSAQGQLSPEAAQMIKTNNVPMNQFNPPIPLPIAHNDWSKIKEGYSYTYSSKIPVDMKELDDDVGFDVAKARYMVAALQLQNIESLKQLK